ncbi:uncharacterized protein LOC124150281 [Haliotis rufescens]|uniref:uncharacterized protein LOC124150281 n=1 Tax=Haliotis rufescens TaxID=6454 RepID=UPI00201ED6D9|nr:uncharacterized protein LOC124150281 [Haliotis rufescens]
MTVIEGHITGSNEKQVKKQDTKGYDDPEAFAANPTVETTRTNDNGRKLSHSRMRKTMSDAEKSRSDDASVGTYCKTRDYCYIAGIFSLGTALTLVLVFFTVLRDDPRMPVEVMLQNTPELHSNDTGNVPSTGTPTLTTENTTVAEQASAGGQVAPSMQEISLLDLLDPIPAPSDSLPQSELHSNDTENVSSTWTPTLTTEITTVAEQASAGGQVAPSMQKISFLGLLDPIPAPSDSLPQSEHHSNDTENVSSTWTPTLTTEITTVAEQASAGGQVAPSMQKISFLGLLDPIPAPSDSLPQSEHHSNDTGNVSSTWTPTLTTEITTVAEQASAGDEVTQEDPVFDSP